VEEAMIRVAAFEEWERALCHHFLLASGDDVSPIRSFEVTPATLAVCRPTRQMDDADAVRSFRAAFRLNDICSAVEHGRYRRLDEIGLPGCFSYLALTLFVDSLMSEEAGDDGAFRAKLSSFLGVERAFSNLAGVAQMWRDLSRWLEFRAAKDGSYRRLVLPDQGAWTHIGYTARLSFPSRLDKSLMARFLRDNPNLLSSPRTFITRFRNEAANPKMSTGLKQAFDEFHEEFFADRRALADHRFWTFVQAAARGGENVAARPIQLFIDLARDQDESWTIALEAIGPEKVDREHFNDLGAAATRALRFGPHELTGSLARGFLVFRQIGNAKWRAAPDISECIGRVIVGLSSDMARQARESLGRLEQSGSWFLTLEPVLVGAAERAAIRLGARIMRRDFIVPVTVSDGVRTGAFWLGRPPFLPQIAADNENLSVRSEDDAVARVSCLAIPRTPGMFRLAADEPVEGRYLISPSASDCESLGTWSRRVSFVADALIHETGRLYGSADPLIEWNGSPSPVPTIEEFEPYWDERRTRVDDLIEATYAGGRSGWNEMDMVALVRAGLGSAINPWDMLRSLQEAGCLTPLLRAQWRGRVWTLQCPALAEFKSRARSVVVVDGCIGARLANEFRRAVKVAGGTAFRRPGVTASAPSLFGCVDADAVRLGAALRWSVRSATFAANGRIAFLQTERRPDRYDLSHRWSWAADRFVQASGSSVGRVTLERWIHPGARDHDLYVVADGSRTWHLLSRNAAVVLAHCLAGKPLFEWSSGVLRRIGREGALPDQLAAVLRIRHLANAGPVEAGYHYWLDEEGLRHLVNALPNLARRLNDSSGKPVAEIVSSVVHSGGRVRAAWKKGSLSTTHS
jgi:hypothetical protein